MHPYRKLLVLATNHLIETGKIDLNSDADVGGNTQAEIGGRNAAIMWHGIGWGELRITVWWDYDHSRHPQANMTGSAREEFTTANPLARRSQYSKFVGVTASAWLERRDGKYLQGKGSNFLTFTYARRGAIDEVKALPDPKPLGFAAEGRTHL